MEELEIVAGAPKDFTTVEHDMFREFVLEGGEVSEVFLKCNIENAKGLVFLRRSGQLQGTAALKRPQDTYREHIADKVETDLSSDRFPYELGYVFLAKSERGKKLSSSLIAAMLSCANGAGVFATTRFDNSAMSTLLVKAEFEPIGEPYLGCDDRKIQLFVRVGT